MSDALGQHEELLEANRALANLIANTVDLSDWTPARDRVLVLPLKEDDLHKSAAGLWVPGDGRKEAGRYAHVVAVGPGRRRRDGSVVEPDVTVGQLVMVGRMVGEVVEERDVEYRLVKSGDILAVLGG